MAKTKPDNKDTEKADASNSASPPANDQLVLSTETANADVINAAADDTKAPENAEISAVETTKPTEDIVSDDAVIKASDDAHAPEAKDDPVSILDELEQHIRAAEKSMDFMAHAILHDIAVAAGALKYKAQQAIDNLSGEQAELVSKLRDLL